jgi:activator of HSP90 ATPase
MKASNAKSNQLKTKVITQKVTIRATPAEVYDAFMDPLKHSAFTGGKATCDPKVGGKISAWDGYITGKNLKLVEGKRIVQKWISTDWIDGYPASTLDLTFTKKGSDTELKMVHSDVPATMAASFADGWKEHYWTHLKSYFREKRAK